MGEVGIKYRIMPDGVEVDLSGLQESIRASLPAEARIEAIQEVPVAFGLKALELMVVLDDRKGGAEQIEEAFSQVDGVQNVEVLDMGLL